jgi:hypothetical protein
VGWVFAIAYGALIGWMVHLATRPTPTDRALLDIAVGAMAGVIGFWVFALRLGFHEAGAIGTISIAGWVWAAASSLLVSLLFAAVRPVRRAQ